MSRYCPTRPWPTCRAPCSALVAPSVVCPSHGRSSMTSVSNPDDPAGAERTLSTSSLGRFLIGNSSAIVVGRGRWQRDCGKISSHDRRVADAGNQSCPPRTTGTAVGDGDETRPQGMRGGDVLDSLQGEHDPLAITNRCGSVSACRRRILAPIRNRVSGRFQLRLRTQFPRPAESRPDLWSWRPGFPAFSGVPR